MTPASPGPVVQARELLRLDTAAAVGRIADVLRELVGSTLRRRGLIVAW